MVKVTPMSPEPQEVPVARQNGQNNNSNDGKLLSQVEIDAIASAVINKARTKDDPTDVLTPGAKELVKTVQSISAVKDALTSPVQTSIEQGMNNFMGTILQTALQNMLSPPQPQIIQQQPKLLHTLAQIAVNNASQNLPQILQVAKEILGESRIQKGYDAGLNYFEQRQSSQNLPQVVLNLDPNNLEHVEYYAKTMGLTNLKNAQQALVQHQRALVAEIQEYQNVQNGSYQESTEPNYYQDLPTEELSNEEQNIVVQTTPVRETQTQNNMQTVQDRDTSSITHVRKKQKSKLRIQEIIEETDEG